MQLVSKMNQVVDIGPKKVKLQDVLDVYEDHIINLIKQYNQSNNSTFIGNFKSKNKHIYAHHLFQIEVEYRLDYIEKHMLEVLEYIQYSDKLKYYVKQNFNRQYIIDRIRELKSYNVECQDNYSIYYQ